MEDRPLAWRPWLGVLIVLPIFGQFVPVIPEPGTLAPLESGSTGEV
jgi:hypothetical protein